MGIKVYVSEIIHVRVYSHQIFLVYRGYKDQCCFIVLFWQSMFYDFN